MIVLDRAQVDMVQPRVPAVLCSWVAATFGRGQDFDRRLSTAILRGVELQANTPILIVASVNSLNLATTALGAAWHGYGCPAEDLGNVEYVLAELSRESHVDLLATFIAHPESGLPMSLGGIIVSLGVTNSWSHIQIAAWLRTYGY